MNEQWIKQIRQKMADYTQPAPEVSWAAIDQAMTAGQPRTLMLRQYWFRGVAAAAVLLIIAGVSIHIMHKPQDIIIEQPVITVESEQNTTFENEQNETDGSDSRLHYIRNP